MMTRHSLVQLPSWLGVLLFVCGIAAADEPAADDTKPTSAIEARAERIVKSMRAAQEKLDGQDTGSATQDLQKSIVAELDELLKAPPQKSPNQSGGAGGGQAGSSGGQSGKQSAGSASRDRQSAVDSATEPSSKSESAAERSRSRAQDSEERTGPARAAEIAAARRRRLEVEVWGHLPEKLREQLLNTYGEKMVPQYEGLVRKFYEALSEPPPKR